MSKLKLNDNLIRILLLTLFLFIFYNFILLPIGFLLPVRLNLNDTLFDLFKNIKRPPELVKETVVLEIDEETLMSIGKKWPWDRTFFADVIDRIKACSPKLLGIDITFSGASTNPEEDDKLKEAILGAGNVILPSYITEEGEYLTPHTAFLSSAHGCGFVNKTADPDYKVRKARLVYKKLRSQKPYFAFEVILAAAYLGAPLDKIIYENNKIIIDNSLIIPVDERGTFYINYLPIKNIMSFSLLNLLNDDTELKSLLKDKIVMLGHTSKTLHDIHQTPLGLTPGTFINTYTLDTILKQIFIKDVPAFILLSAICILLLLTAIITYRLSLPKGTLFLGILLLSTIIAFLIISFYDFRADYFSVLFLVLLTYGSANGYKYGYLLYSGNVLKKMVITDNITGLATPRYFQFKLKLDIARTSEAKTGISVVIFNIPSFQELFKKYDQPQIEIILRQISAIIKQNSRRKADLLARWKEDKFSAILLKTDVNDAVKYCQKIISKIEENEFLYTDGVIHLNICAGISNYPLVKTDSAKVLIAYAESAGNRATADPGKISIFNPQQDKIQMEALRKELISPEEDYLTIDIAEREKELLTALNELKKSQKAIQDAHFDTILSLVKALEEKDQYTAGHSERVANYAVGIAKEMKLDDPEIALIKQSALLHDIGKIGLQDKILHKKEALTEEEVNEIKKHPSLGARILEKSPFFKDHIPLVLHHQEKYDGKGYPHGLSGKFIPRGAQIIAIADAIDAMTSGRGYNRILSIPEVIEELKKSSGSHFDPDYVAGAINFLNTSRLP